MQSHIRKVYACLAVTCHLHFWQNDGIFLRATAVTGGGTDTEIRVSTESRPRRRKFSRHPSRDSNPRPFNHKSGALTTDLYDDDDDDDIIIIIIVVVVVVVHLFFLFSLSLHISIRF